MKTTGTGTSLRSGPMRILLGLRKSSAMHLSWYSLWYQHKLGDEGTKSSPPEKDLGVLLDKKLNMIQQRALAAQKAKSFCDFVAKYFTNRVREHGYTTSGFPIMGKFTEDQRAMARALFWTVFK